MLYIRDNLKYYAQIMKFFSINLIFTPISKWLKIKNI